MLNLLQVRKPSEEHSYRVFGGPQKKLSVVTHALYKNYPTRFVESIVNGYRRSNATADALIADVMRCDIPKPPCVKDSIFYEALEEVQRLFAPPQKYRPVHYCDTRYYPWTLNSSVEAPYSTDPAVVEHLEYLFEEGIITDKKKTFHNLYNYVFVNNRPLIHLIKEGKGKGDRFFAWNTSHARAHLVNADEDDKIRLVHGVPKLLLQAEVMLLWPYLNYLRKGTTPILWGYETMEGGIYKLYSEFFTRDFQPDVFIGIDWSSFDKRVSFALIDEIHSRWFEFLDLTKGYMPSAEYPETELIPWRIENLWKYMNNAVKHTPMLLPDGSLWKRRHSTLPSGMLQTQVLDSWINAVMTLTCLKEIGFDFTKIKIKVLGDDDIIAAIMPPSVQIHEILPRVKEIAWRRFGAELSLKSEVSDSLENMQILGYRCDRSFPYRDPRKLLAQLLYPERYTSFETMKARAVGIAMASCGMDETVYNVCKDVFEYSSRHTDKPANPKGFTFASYLTNVVEVDWNVFPDRLSLFERVLSPPVQNLRLDKRFWNKEIFPFEY
jgi:hypothetical protein